MRDGVDSTVIKRSRIMPAPPRRVPLESSNGIVCVRYFAACCLVEKPLLPHAAGRILVEKPMLAHAAGRVLVAKPLLTHAAGRILVAKPLPIHAAGGILVKRPLLTHAAGRILVAKTLLTHVTGYCASYCFGMYSSKGQPCRHSCLVEARSRFHTSSL